MNADILMLFAKTPGALPLYEEFERRVLAAYPDATIMVKATQISFYNTYAFAWAWPPRKRKGMPEVCMMVTFGLDCELVHSRVMEATEPYPNRWTHHVIVQRLDEIDGELMEWIDRSYRFSLSKRKGKKL